MARKTATLEEVRSRQFLGHPIGLWALFTTEMWERFCYYGMRALLVLYLISTLTDSNPGFGWSQAGANELYGWFTGLVYLTPLIGGFLADRYLGQHRSVLLGGVLMALGEFCLFFSEYARVHAVTTITLDTAPGALLTFILGLALITIGNGFFKPCISVMVGGLYEKDDPRRDDAFSIFYMGINVGAFLAPFIAGSIGEKISWHWGFLTAGVGMCFGLLTYSMLRPKYLGSIGMRLKEEPTAETKENDSSAADARETVAQAETAPEAPKGLSKVEKDRIAVILTLTFFCIAFWSVFEQAGTSLNIFAKNETNRQVPTAIGANLPGFLANQDEIDTKIAMNELRSNLVDLEDALHAFEDDSEKYPELADLPESFARAVADRDFTDVRSKLEGLKDNLEADEYDAFCAELGDVETSLESASRSLDKANEARKMADQEPLAIDLSNLKTALSEGRDAKKEIDAAIASAFDETLKTFPEEPTEDIRSNLLRQAETKVMKDRQAAFLRAEKDRIDKKSAIWTFPTTWYQSVNAFVVVLFVPIFNLMWGFLRRRNLEPSTPVKFGVGLIFLSIAFMFMIFGAIQSSNTNGNAGPYWLLLTYTLCTFGELCLSPVGLSMVSRLAPPRFASLLMGVWFLSSAIAGYLSGKLAAVLGSGDGGSERVSFCFGADKGLADFFLIMTLAPLIAGLIVFILAPKLRKMMHENE